MVSCRHCLLQQQLLPTSNVQIKHFSDREKNAYEEAFEVAKVQAIIAACSTISGYWFTVYFIDRIGRVRIQTMGFISMATVYLAIGISYNEYWKNHRVTSFRAFNGLIFFLSNFGPNTTTFIVPAELFSARFRSTCHGISGAAGKVGAIVGSVGFLWASHDNPKRFGMTAALVILSGVCVMGAMVTYFFTPETKGRSLEENENDDEPK
jgi:PHS family inorganic phosphate transporter-like MFS transporter